MNQPIISFRSASSPYNAISAPLIYSETVALQSGLPILSGEVSDPQIIRIYNNYSIPPSSSIATAYNFSITTYDSSSILTASTPPVSNMWMYFQEVGYGEQSSIPGLFSSYLGGLPYAVGGSLSTMIPTVGSDGTLNAQIRAGLSNAGVGFLQLSSYVSPPLGQSTATWNFAISCSYNWNS